MAKIIGGIAASHTPTIGFALDQGKQNDPVWAPIFEAFMPIKNWLAEKKPDVLLMIYNDHITSFFFDHYSAFTLGVGEEYHTADEGGGARVLPPVAGHPALAQHIGHSLMADEFDMSFFQKKGLDHGCFSPLSMLCDRDGDQWASAIVPLQVGVLQFPIPTARRCYKLGQALRRAIESYPEDLNVVVVATGGLSHQVHGERCGFNNTEWDARFLDLLEKDPERLAQLTHAEYAELGGFEGAEVIMWLIMRGALSAHVKKVHQTYYLPSMTGIATAIYESTSAEPIAAEVDRHRQHMATQLAGIDRLTGTYPFDLNRSVRHYRLNKFLHDLVEPAKREAFKANEAQTMRDAGLSDEEISMVLNRDWRALIQYGAIFFVLEKLSAVVGSSNLHIYSGMRGESLEAFQKTRNTQANYSVAGGQVDSKAWDNKKS